MSVDRVKDGWTETDGVDGSCWAGYQVRWRVEPPLRLWGGPRQVRSWMKERYLLLGTLKRAFPCSWCSAQWAAYPPYSAVQSCTLGEGDGTDPVLLYKSLRCTSERVGGGTAHARLGRLCCLSRRRRRADFSGVGVFALGGQWGGPATSGGASRYPQPRRAGFATPSTAFEPAKCGWRSRRLGVPGYQHSPGSQLQRRALPVWPGWLTGATSPPPNERRIP